MESVCCNLCGSDRHRLLYQQPDLKYYPEEMFNVVECLTCGLGFVNPRPSEKEIQKYYPIHFFDWFEEDPALQEKRYKNEAEYLRIVNPGGRKLLDVGCANGAFPLFMAKRGWRAEGLEISPQTSEPEHVAIHRIPLPELPGDNQYGAISMWAVLEHVHDPMAYIAAASRLLAPGGFLFVQVPNFGSLQSRRLYREDIPRHLYFFTKHNIGEYLTRNGLKLVSSTFSDDIYSMSADGWLLYLKTVYWDRQPYTIGSSKKGRPAFFLERHLKRSMFSSITYLLHHPVDALDTVLTPPLEFLQKVLRCYGQVTYVAVKTP